MSKPPAAFDSPLEIRGRCHPPPISDPLYKGWTIRASEVDPVMPKYVGKPVFVEHDPKRSVGAVKRVWRDKVSGSLVVDLALNHDESGWAAMRDIQSGKLGELSMGFKATGNDKFERVSEPEPVEISLVEKGAMADALIFAIKVDDHVAVSTERSKAVCTPRDVSVQNSAPATTPKMQAEQETAAAAATTAPVATGASSAIAEFDPTKLAPERLAQLVKTGLEFEANKIAELKSALQNYVGEAWKKIVLEDESQNIMGLGEAVEALAGTKEGQILLTATAKISGNYLKFEKLYQEKQKELQEQETKIKLFEQSKLALQAEEERKVSVMKDMSFAPIFSVAVANSGKSSAGESAGDNGAKRARLADLFNPKVMSGLSEMKAELMSNKVLSPTAPTFNFGAQ